MHIFKMNEFFRGMSLPQPETIEPREKKLPKQTLSIPHLLDFLKVTIFKCTYLIFKVDIQ